MKNTLWTKALLLFIFCNLHFLAHGAEATQVLPIPAFCESTDFTIKVRNNSEQERLFWIQRRQDEQVFENTFAVPGSQSIEITGSALFATPESLSLKTHDEFDLQFEVSCLGFAPIELSSSTNPHIFHKLPPGSQTVKLSLLNLFPLQQKVFLRFLSARGQVLDETSLESGKYYDTINIKIDVPAGASQFEVLGEHRLHSWIFAQTNWNEVFSSGQAKGPFQLSPPKEGSYFLVSLKNTASDSFVVQIKDLALVKKAREQIQNPGFEKIVVARIQLGHGGFNRSFTDKDKTPYSWSVSEVNALADFAHIDCNGSPDFVEENILQKINEGGRICFWSYRILRELTPREITSGQLKKP